MGDPPPSSRGEKKISDLFSVKLDNIPRVGVWDDEIAELFSKFGDIGDVYIPRDRATGKDTRGFCFVRYHRKSDALACVDKMDRIVFHGNVLHVAIAANPPPAGSGPRDKRVVIPPKGDLGPMPSVNRNNDAPLRDSGSRYNDQRRDQPLDYGPPPGPPLPARDRVVPMDRDHPRDQSRRGPSDRYETNQRLPPPPDRPPSVHDDRNRYEDDRSRPDNYDRIGDRRGGYDDRQRGSSGDRGGYDERPRGKGGAIDGYQDRSRVSPPLDRGVFDRLSRPNDRRAPADDRRDYDRPPPPAHDYTRDGRGYDDRGQSNRSSVGGYGRRDDRDREHERDHPLPSRAREEPREDSRDSRDRGGSRAPPPPEPRDIRGPRRVADREERDWDRSVSGRGNGSQWDRYVLPPSDLRPKGDPGYDDSRGTRAPPPLDRAPHDGYGSRGPRDAAPRSRSPRDGYESHGPPRAPPLERGGSESRRGYHPVEDRGARDRYDSRGGAPRPLPARPTRDGYDSYGTNHPRGPPPGGRSPRRRDGGGYDDRTPLPPPPDRSPRGRDRGYDDRGPPPRGSSMNHIAPYDDRGPPLPRARSPVSRGRDYDMHDDRAPPARRQRNYNDSQRSGSRGARPAMRSDQVGKPRTQPDDDAHAGRPKRDLSPRPSPPSKQPRVEEKPAELDKEQEPTQADIDAAFDADVDAVDDDDDEIIAEPPPIGADDLDELLCPSSPVADDDDI